MPDSSASFELALDQLHASLPATCGFAISVWSGKTGAPLIQRCAGLARENTPWQPDTLAPVWSTGKGPAAFTVLLALLERGVALTAPIREIWPEWPHGGNFLQLLSHQIGLAALDTPAAADSHAAVIAQLLAQPLNWPLGSGHGYHPRTIGYVWDEVTRRLAGKTLAACWREKVADPHGLDIWFGLPEPEFPRLARVRPGPLRPRPAERDFRMAFGRPQSLTHRAFNCLKGWSGIDDFNTPGPILAGPPAFGGVASAEGLAKFYALLTTDAFPLDAREAAETLASQESDLVLLDFTAFTAGFQKDPLHPLTGEKLRFHYGPGRRAFGHPGAGGSIAFADPELGLGVGLTLNFLEPGVFPQELIANLTNAAIKHCS